MQVSARLGGRFQTGDVVPLDELSLEIQDILERTFQAARAWPEQPGVQLLISAGPVESNRADNIRNDPRKFYDILPIGNEELNQTPDLAQAMRDPARLIPVSAPEEASQIQTWLERSNLHFDDGREFFIETQEGAVYQVLALAVMVTPALVEPTLEPTEPAPAEPPPTPTETACTGHTATTTVSAPAEVKVGQPVTVTVTLANQGCTALGLPKYTLSAQPPIFAPAAPEPAIVYGSIPIGGSGKATFSLRAITPGQANLHAGASFEVHLGYPGPAYWGGSSAEPATINVSE